MSYLPLCVMVGLGAAAIAHDRARGALGAMLVGPLALAVALLPPAGSLPSSHPPLVRSARMR
jgi:hypothetical protein